jgi:hypothetical protein
MTASKKQTTTKKMEIAAVRPSSRRSHVNEAEAAHPHAHDLIGTHQNLALVTAQSLAPQGEREDVHQALEDLVVVSEADQEVDLHMQRESQSTRRVT